MQSAWPLHEARQVVPMGEQTYGLQETGALALHTPAPSHTGGGASMPLAHEPLPQDVDCVGYAHVS
jgi:hypothetical protein